MADTNTVPIPSSIPEAELLICSFIFDGDGLQAGMFADYDAKYEALYQFGLISDEYLTWTIQYLTIQAKVKEPFVSVQYMYPLLFILAKTPRARRSTLRSLYVEMEAVAYAPQALVGDTYCREKAKTVLRLLSEYPREKLIRG